MGTFEYVMALVSIVVGLGLTHILKALGAAIHRLKKHDEPVRLEAVYLLWIAFVLIWLVSFWWWEFKFKTIDLQWTFESYLFVLFYAIVLFLTFLATGDWRCLVGTPIAGYAFAWVAHLTIERNRPATFGHPLWSLMGDFYMLYLWMTARLAPELVRSGAH